jgi:hypothetical protein
LGPTVFLPPAPLRQCPNLTRSDLDNSGGKRPAFSFKPKQSFQESEMRAINDRPRNRVAIFA